MSDSAAHKLREEAQADRGSAESAPENLAGINADSASSRTPAAAIKRNEAAVLWGLTQVRLSTGKLHQARARRKKWVEYAKRVGATDVEINGASLNAR